MFALVDCNSCYASCEQIFRPDLRGQPVVVLSNNDGCIVARSKEAKALNIPDLEPFFKIEGLLRHHKVHIFSSNYALYGDINHRITHTLSQFSPEIEVYSIDEMFLTCDGDTEALKSWGQQVKERIWRHIRMPVSVGVAPTKTLAKMANHVAKKSTKANGVCVLDTQEKWQWVQKRLPVQGIWGVGKRLAKRLNAMGINNAYDLATSPPKAIHKHFGVTLERTIAELNGTVAIELETQPSAKKHIFCSRSFAEKITQYKPLEQAVCAYASRAAEKLRAQDHLVSAVQVSIRTSPHEDHFYSNSQVVSFSTETDDTRAISLAAKQALQAIYRPDKRYLKASVGLLGLIDRRYQQNTLFDCANQQKQSRRLMQVMDSINQRYGQSTSYLASQGQRERWRMRQHYRSPAYTTRWSDIPVIKCR